MCGVQPDVGAGPRVATERKGRAWSGGAATLPTLCALLEQLSRADPQGLSGAPAQQGHRAVGTTDKNSPAEQGGDTPPWDPQEEQEVRITEAQEAPRAGFIWIVPSDPHSPGGRGYSLDQVGGCPGSQGWRPRMWELMCGFGPRSPLGRSHRVASVLQPWGGGWGVVRPAKPLTGICSEISERPPDEALLLHKRKPRHRQRWGWSRACGGSGFQTPVVT